MTEEEGVNKKEVELELEEVKEEMEEVVNLEQVKGKQMRMEEEREGRGKGHVVEEGGTRWLHDPNPACADLVARLEAGSEVESRDFLRPIFKWMKSSSSYCDKEKPFSFLEWMATIRENGDATLGIPPLPHLQPKYGYNTIVTMSQRNDWKETALRAYECMISRGDEIDVFTYTSLLDVIGRNGHFDDSLSIYDKMRTGKNQPNVVTFITLIRVLAGWHGKVHSQADVARAKYKIFELLEEADELNRKSQLQSLSDSSDISQGDSAPVFVSGTDGKLEVSVFNAALAGFVKLHDFDFFKKVLQMMKTKKIELSAISIDIICKYYNIHFTSGHNSTKFADINEYGAYLVGIGAISEETNALLEDNLNSYLERKSKKQQSKKNKTKADTYTDVKLSSMRQGCLGRDAPPSMRESVITHDLEKLFDRLKPNDSSQLHESDFITLLHQCRKRKWSDQIVIILNGMRDISTVGIPDRNIPPQYSLVPSLLTYEAALAGYFCTAAVKAARSLFLETLKISDIWSNVSFEPELDFEEDTFSSNALHYFRFVMKGFLDCGAASEAYQTFLDMLRMGISPYFPIVKCLFRGLGCEPQLGVSLLEQLLISTDNSFLQSYSLTSVEGYSKPKLSLHSGDKIGKGNCELLLTLFESIAVLGYPEHVDNLINMCLSSACEPLRQLLGELMSPTAVDDNFYVSFVVNMLMAACSSNDICHACAHIKEWIDKGYMPPVAFVYSLAIDALADSFGGTSQKSTCGKMQSLPFRGFLRVGAVKKLHCYGSNLNVGSILSWHKTHYGYLYDEFISANEKLFQFFTSFAVVDQNDQYENDFADTDWIMKFYLQKYIDGFSPDESIFGPQKSFPHLILFYHHAYMRLLLVRSRTLQQKYYTHIENAFGLLSNLPSNLGCDVYTQLILNFGINLASLDIPSNFQARVIAAFLKCSPSQFLSLSLPKLFSHWSSCQAAFSIPYLPNVDVLKEIFKFVLSMQTLFDANAIENLRQLMAASLVIYLRNSLCTPSKIIQVINNFKLFSVMEIEAFDKALVQVVPYESSNNSPANPSPLTILASYIKSASEKKVERREVCIRLCRLLVDDGRGDLAAALLCRFQVVDCEEFREILYPSEKLLNGIPSQGGNPLEEFGLDKNIDFETDISVIGELPVLNLECVNSPSVVLVQDLRTIAIAEASFSAMIAAAEAHISHFQNSEKADEFVALVNDSGESNVISARHVLAIDSEWRPQSMNSGKPMHKCSLLQIATPSDIFLFDLMHLERDWYEDVQVDSIDDRDELWSRYAVLISRIFSCKYLLKLGFHLKGDIIRLCESFPSSAHYCDLESDHELSASEALPQGDFGGGLATLCKTVLGVAMDKRMQCSDWQRRPLHEKQIQYAAIDAFVLILIWYKLKEIQWSS